MNSTKPAKKRKPGRLLTILLALAILSIPAVFNDCSVKNWEAPSWETEFVLPLTNSVQDLADIANDSTIVITDSGKFNITMEQEIEEKEVGEENLKVQGQEKRFSTSIGNISLKSPGEEATDPITLADLIPSSVLQQFVGLPYSLIPAVEIQDPTTGEKMIKRSVQFANYEYTTIDTGYIRLTVENNTVLPLGPPLIIQLVDQDDKFVLTGNLIAADTFHVAIPPGGSDSVILSLTGKTMSNEMEVQISGSTGSGAGLDGTFQSGDEQSYFIVKTFISDMSVKSAQAVVPSQRFSDHSFVSVEDSTKIVSATVNTGTISLDIKNNLPVDALINISSPYFTKDGSPFSYQLALNIRENLSDEIDLSGYKLVNPSGGLIDSVGFNVDVLTIASDSTDSDPDTLATITNADSISTSISLSELTFNAIEGVLPETEVEIPKIEQELGFDFPEGFGNISLGNVIFDLTILNEVNIPVSLELDIKGWNDEGDTVAIEVNETINPGGGPGNPDSTLIRLDKDGVNGVLPASGNTIVDLVNLLPDKIEVTGKATVGDGVTVGSVSKDDRIWGKVKLTAPLSLSLGETKLDTDPEELDLDEDARKNLTENVKESKIVIVTENHVPLGGEVNFYFASDTTKIFDQPLLKIPKTGIIEMRPAPVNDDGIVNKSIIDTLKIEMSEDDMQIFNNTPLYFATRIHLPGTEGKVVQVLPTDYIRIKAYLTAKILVDFED